MSYFRHRLTSIATTPIVAIAKTSTSAMSVSTVSVDWDTRGSRSNTGTNNATAGQCATRADGVQS